MTLDGISDNEHMFIMEGMDQEIKNFMKLSYERERRDTFKTWVFPDDKKCNATKLAEAGFYFVGSKNEPDAVQCIFCNKALDGWDENDDPWQEHKQHSPQCQFIKFNKPESKLTVYQFIELQFELSKNWIKNLFEARKTKILEQQKNLRKEILDLKKL